MPTLFCRNSGCTTNGSHPPEDNWAFCPIDGTELLSEEEARGHWLVAERQQPLPIEAGNSPGGPASEACAFEEATD